MNARMVRRDDSPDIRVDEAGARDGRPILFIHGYSQSRLSWTKQMNADALADYQLLAMDLRGHGCTEKPERAYGNSGRWADDIRAVLDDFAVENVTIVAWSYGGLVALDYLDTYGTDRVAGLHLVGAISGIGTEAATEVLGSGYLDLFPELVSPDAEEGVRALSRFVRRCVEQDLSPEEFHYLLGFNVVVPPRVRDALRARTVSHLDTLDTLNVPALLAHGESDRIIEPDATCRHTELLDDATTSWYPETGHSPFWEAPKRFNQELSDFIGGLSPSA
jgi:non-heme chloroperoxidase